MIGILSSMLTIEKIQVYTALVGCILGTWMGWVSVENYIWCKSNNVNGSVFYITKSQMRGEVFRVFLHLIFLIGGLTAVSIRRKYALFYLDVPLLITRNLTMTLASVALMIWTGLERYDHEKVKKMRAREKLMLRRAGDIATKPGGSTCP